MKTGERKKMNRRLRLKIIERFGTQADFASKVKADETLVSRVIRGRRAISKEMRAAWADALRCAPEDIFENGGQDE